MRHRVQSGLGADECSKVRCMGGPLMREGCGACIQSARHARLGPLCRLRVSTTRRDGGRGEYRWRRRRRRHHRVRCSVWHGSTGSGLCYESERLLPGSPLICFPGLEVCLGERRAAAGQPRACFRVMPRRRARRHRVFCAIREPGSAPRVGRYLTWPRASRLYLYRWHWALAARQALRRTLESPLAGRRATRPAWKRHYLSHSCTRI